MVSFAFIGHIEASVHWVCFIVSQKLLAANVQQGSALTQTDVSAVWPQSDGPFVQTESEIFKGHWMKNFEIWLIQNRCVCFLKNPGLPSSELSKLDWLTAESSAAFSSSTTKQESGVTLTFLICKYKTARGDVMQRSSDSAVCRLDLRAARLYLALSPSRQTFSKITRECKRKKHHWLTRVLVLCQPALKMFRQWCGFKSVLLQTN